MSAQTIFCLLTGAGIGAGLVLSLQVIAGLWLNARVTTGTTCQQCGEAITQHPQGWRCKRCAAIPDWEMDYSTHPPKWKNEPHARSFVIKGGDK